jgi:hypothetical protein
MTEKNGPRYSIQVDTLISVTVSEAWSLLVDPVQLGALFWGSTVESDFKVGRPIVWRGTWDGKPFEDRGFILERVDGSVLRCSHWSPTSGTPNEEAWRHVLTFRLSQEAGGVRVVFRHENIPTLKEKAHSEPMWRQLLDVLKETLEREGAGRRKAVR